MNNLVKQFISQTVRKGGINNKRILEIGSFDTNGSPREIIEPYGPKEYIGLDVNPGKGVDVVCDAVEYANSITDKFDGVICCDMLEHADKWWETIETIPTLLKNGGWGLFTSVSPGYPLHLYDDDNWRFGVEDFWCFFGCFVSEVTTPKEYIGVYVNEQKFVGSYFVFDDSIFKKRKKIFDRIMKNRAVYNMTTGKRTTPKEWMDILNG